MKRQLPKEDTQMTNKHVKRYPTSYVIKKLLMKIMRYHYKSIRTAKIQNTDEDMKQQELSLIAGGNVKSYSHFESQFGSFLQN